MVKFIILSTQRSGSTFFRKFIGSHPQIESHGEIFISRKWDSELRKDRYYQYCNNNIFYKFFAYTGMHRMIVPSFLKSFYQNVSQMKKAKGFKLMYNQEKKFKILSTILKSDNILFIHFIRLNLLKLIVSREILRETNIAHTVVKVPQKKIMLNTYKILEKLKKIETTIDLYRKYLKYSNVIEVFYETFSENPLEESKKVLKYLDLDTNVNLNSNLKKISSNNLENVIKNYNEVKKVLFNTKYIKYI